MSWQEGVAAAVVFLGLGAGAFLVAQRPSFLIAFGQRLGIGSRRLTYRQANDRPC